MVLTLLLRMIISVLVGRLLMDCWVVSSCVFSWVISWFVSLVVGVGFILVFRGFCLCLLVWYWFSFWLIRNAAGVAPCRAGVCWV